MNKETTKHASKRPHRAGSVKHLSKYLVVPSLCADFARIVLDSPDWQSPAYQDSARKTIVATHRLLVSAEGTPGQDYLFSRGMTKETWATYLLGYGHTIHPTRRQNMEAIFIPWLASDGKTITAIQHRFIDPTLEKGERYTLKPGSEPIIFGLQALAPAHTLTIVEGEFNCMALHQVGQQAVSVGSEANINHLPRISEYLSSYERLLIWFDKVERGQQVVSWLDNEGLFRKEKTQVVLSPSDANNLLLEGKLAKFVPNIIGTNNDLAST